MIDGNIFGRVPGLINNQGYNAWENEEKMRSWIKEVQNIHDWISENKAKNLKYTKTEDGCATITCNPTDPTDVSRYEVCRST